MRKIPPPVPVNPAKNPRPPPTLIATGRVGGDVCGGSLRRTSSRAAENSRTTPIRIFRIAADGCRKPPRYAAGMESNAKGQNNFHEKYPARQNWNVPMEATKMLSKSAVGRITAGAIPNNVMVAM